MKNKFLIVSCALLFLFSSIIFASGARELSVDERIVEVLSVEAFEDTYSILVKEDNGNEIIYHADNQTIVKPSEYALKEGAYLAIKDNGIMTMSLPAQAYAEEIRDVSLGVNLGVYDFTSLDSNITYPGAKTWDATLNEDLSYRFSYSYGYELLKNFTSQALILKSDYFARGTIDFWSLSEDTLITVDEMNSVLNEYFENVYYQGQVGSLGIMPDSIDAILELERSDDLYDLFAYSYAYYIGFQNYYSGLNIDPYAFIDGFMHAAYNQAPLLNTEERGASMDEYSQILQSEYDEYIAALSESNLQEAEEFLAQNSLRSEVITLDNGLQYEVITQGSGDIPKEDSIVSVNYVLKDVDGNTLEQNSGVSLTVGSVVPGFKYALLNMSVGSKVIAYIHPSLGYGDSLLETIEPNSLLIFEIELLSIN